jgi:hypothetical protein
MHHSSQLTTTCAVCFIQMAKTKYIQVATLHTRCGRVTSNDHMIATSIGFFFFICLCRSFYLSQKLSQKANLRMHINATLLPTQIIHGDWLSGVLPLISCNFFSSFHSQTGCVQHENFKLELYCMWVWSELFLKGDLWLDFVPSKACMMRPIDIFLCRSP